MEVAAIFAMTVPMGQYVAVLPCGSWVQMEKLAVRIGKPKINRNTCKHNTFLFTV